MRTGLSYQKREFRTALFPACFPTPDGHAAWGKKVTLLASPRGLTEKYYLGFPKAMTQLDFSKIKSSPVHTLRTFNMFFSFPLKYEQRTNKRTKAKGKN